MNLRNKLFTLLVLMVLCASPLMVVDLQESDAADSYFKYTLTNGSGTAITVTAENAPLKDFDSKGYGPFNSFYAAFDSTNNNKMICHLNPNNLGQAITKTIMNGYESYFTAVNGTYSTMNSTLLGNANIMWCLPTIYWYVENGSLVLTNDPSKGDAFAHTINSKSTPYNYLAIGVYEAYNNNNLLMSKTGVTPTSFVDLADFRAYANAVTINTDGKGVNGDAGLWNYYQFQLYRLCALAYAENYNVQSTIGWGYACGDTGGAHATGYWNSSGPAAGTPGTSYESSSRNGVKLYIENAWGSLYDYVDDAWWDNGLWAGQNSTVDKITSDKNNKGDTPTNITPGISGFGTSPDTAHADSWGMPTAGGGSGTTGTCDTFSSSASGGALIVGGNWVDSGNAGISYLNDGSVNAWYGYYGTRLAFVFDADPATPTVTLDHSDLTTKGGDATGLPTEFTFINDDARYPDLGKTPEGYTHIGWYVGDTFYDKTAIVATTVSHTAYSVWKDPVSVVTFHVGGSVVNTIEVPKGSSGVDYTPTLSGSVFKGWYYDQDLTRPLDQTAVIDADMDLYAKTVPLYTVSFYSEGSLVYTVTVESGAAIGEYTPPPRDGYTFGKWCTEVGLTDRYDLATPVTSDLTLYAMWIEDPIIISFYVEGELYSTLAVPKGSVGIVYTPVMVTGVFAGWYYDVGLTEKYDATRILDKDISLYACGVPPLIFTSEPNAAANIQQVNSYGMFFFDATDSSGRYQIHWDFGDGNTSDEAIAYNTYSEPGLYTVTLTVTNIYGESATSTYELDLRDGSATNDVKWFAIGALCVIAVGFVVRRIL